MPSWASPFPETGLHVSKLTFLSFWWLIPSSHQDAQHSTLTEIILNISFNAVIIRLSLHHKPSFLTKGLVRRFCLLPNFPAQFFQGKRKCSTWPFLLWPCFPSSLSIFLNFWQLLMLYLSWLLSMLPFNFKIFFRKLVYEVLDFSLHLLQVLLPLFLSFVLVYNLNNTVMVFSAQTLSKA